MFKFVLNKIIHKKWMVASLLIGGILMISIAACNPMYVKGALQNLLVTNLDNAYAESGEYPTKLKINKSIVTSEGNFDSIKDGVISEIDKSVATIDLPIENEVEFYHGEYSTITSYAHSENDVVKVFLETCTMKNFKEHITVVSGKDSSDEPDKNGIYDVLVSETTFNNLDLVLDEVIAFNGVAYPDGSAVKVRVVGIFEDKENDSFWVKKPAEYDWQCFLTEKAFSDMINKIYPSTKCGACSVDKYVLYDYSQIKYDDVQNILAAANILKDSKYEVNFAGNFKNYSTAQKKVVATMNILQVPTLFLLAIFIYMVSSQMLAMESNEIAMLKSRGVSRLQIILVYLMQSGLLAGVSLIIGIPLAFIFCKVVGVSNSFMEFVGRKSLPLSINLQTMGYALGAALFTILVMTIPVIPISKTTIVEYKQTRNNHKPFWKKFYLDFIFLGVSLYGWYNFTGQTDNIIKQVLSGASLDPLLFLCSSLFILSAGMVAVRIIPLIVWVIYRIGKNRWSTAAYTAFLQIIRTTDKQDFIMVFLVLTIAFGIFNANTARTINENEENRIWASNGADLVIKEEWKTNLPAVKYARVHNMPEVPLTYEEPDIWKYDELSENVESRTKVYRETGLTARISNTSKTASDVMVMGINTKEFGETAYMREGALDKHWFNYLNEMAPDTSYILVSKNMKKNMELKIGDTIEYTRYNEADQISGTSTGVICGFIDEWPGYSPTYMAENSDGSTEEKQRYLIVANYDQVMDAFGDVPYEIWFKNKYTSSYMYEYVEKNKISMVSFMDSQNDLVKMKNDPVFQETNGMLTISFIIVLILCTVGFLIYWIFSIKSRELLFGIYRAMGLSMKEIIKMLMLEQLFSSVFAIIVGVVVGIISSYLYIPLIEIAYGAANVNNDIYSNPIDMIRLGSIVVIMLVVCMYILGKLLSTLKISQALKLGEE